MKSASLDKKNVWIKKKLYNSSKNMKFETVKRFNRNRFKKVKNKTILYRWKAQIAAGTQELIN